MPIAQPKPASTYNSKRSSVLNVAELRTVLVRWTNEEGRETLTLCLVGAKSSEDGGMGVWVLGEQDELTKTLKIANKTVTRGVRALLGSETAKAAPEEPSVLLEELVGMTKASTDEDE